MKKYSPAWWQSLPPEKAGKETEKLVESLFTEWNKWQSFAWHRLPDARSARGFLHSQPADYIYRSGQFSGFIEVKALKHPYRLPTDRVTQLATLKKWSLAGSQNLILVHHYIEGVWRVLYPGGLDASVPSWDLRNVETYPDAESALFSTGYFDL